MIERAFLDALDARAAAGRPARFWLRDDDAALPTPALDMLLDLTAPAGVPVALAVIPARSGDALAVRLAGEARVSVAVHGWAHLNHAGAADKKQELGGHRPVAQVLGELARGHVHLAGLHPGQFLPVLVPPWNRIDAAVIAGLQGIGFTALSVFGPERSAPIPMINTHVDLMDWRGTGGAKPDAILWAEFLRAMGRDAPLGFLTHHLVHDAQAWAFLRKLFAVTANHPGCAWVGLPELVVGGGVQPAPH